ncbi:MAG TPA: pyridoxamine 5'-phosphate oxidase family protein [Anaerolineales bacterium]
MTEIKVTRPQFPKGYVDNPTSSLNWEYVVQRLAGSKNYWLCSVRPDGRPHSIPRWGVFLDNKLYYDGSPETRHAINLLTNPHVSVHLESGDEALIAEGTCAPAGTPEPQFAARLAAEYRSKYEKFGYAPEADQWNEGGLYVFKPSKVLAWTSFMDDPTKFVIE